MTRDELFRQLESINDPVNDYPKILGNLHYTHFFLMDRYKKILSEYELTPQQSNVLGIILYYYPGASSLEQIKSMVLEPSSDVSRIVTRLCEKGYAEKVANKNNKRKVEIRASENGEKLSRAIASNAKLRSFTKDIGLEEARTFISILQKLRQEA
jgi:MarR family transcriptional regulator, repressor for mepA